ncbi:glycerophosphoryl diester phosphodiesterase [Telmatospirillum sp.]|uniref:glycerophosphoryl diester phosphodiesterase n=1 Tax=Telmatospirillum sp. TaxID=2079197 RepID=UPI00284E762F|nr:glycerophosphoryl diester phosphodiesterase [Telmatospirillum sp.]MDR3440437.1 glycerophosphoryl diester phosphodiesterase [Telmatospirillum sp.]
MSSLVLPRVIGHRGVAAMAPENTLAGFALAARSAVGWIELDVQLTADGVPVVFHDDRLERTTDGQGRLVETSYVDLLRLDAGRWFGESFAGQRIPSLAEVLTLLVETGLGLCLEVKADEQRGAQTAVEAIACLRHIWPATASPPLLSSFARSAVAVMADQAPDWQRGLLVEELPDDWHDVTRRLGCHSLHVDQCLLNEQQAAAVKGEGLALLAYTVNDRERAETLWGWGVDALFSDCPENLLGAPSL